MKLGPQAPISQLFRPPPGLYGPRGLRIPANLQFLALQLGPKGPILAERRAEGPVIWAPRALVPANLGPKGHRPNRPRRGPAGLYSGPNRPVGPKGP